MLNKYIFIVITDGFNYGRDITTPGLYGADKNNKNIILEIKDIAIPLEEMGKTEFILTNENRIPLSNAVIQVLV